MPLRFDIWSIRDGESHPSEATHSAIHQLRERMQRARRRPSAGKREVERGNSGGISRLQKKPLRIIQCLSDSLAEVVEKFAKARAIFFRHIPHAFTDGGDSTTFAEVADADRLEGGAIFGRGDVGEGLPAKGFNLLFHVDWYLERRGGQSLVRPSCKINAHGCAMTNSNQAACFFSKAMRAFATICLKVGSS